MLRKVLAALTMTALMALAFVPFAAAADLVSMDERYFLRRDDCGGANDNLHLSTRAGSDSEGCAFLFGVANEAGLDLAYEFPQADVETYLIDTEGTISGQLATMDFIGLGTTAAVLTVEVEITAMHGGFSTATLVDETYELVPVAGANPTFTFEADIDDALAGQELRGFQATVVIRGVHANHTVKLSGDSYFSFPHLVEEAV